MRKIPLKEREYLEEDLKPVSRSKEDDEAPEDPLVQAFLIKIRDIAAQDRDIYDKVCCRVSRGL